MTDHSITVANSLNLFGVAPSDKWNAYAWNAFLWGEGTADLGVAVVHLISNSLTLSDAYGKGVTKLVSETLSVTGDMSSEVLFDAEGYRYVFPDRTTEGEERDFSTWTSGTAASATWTSGTVTSTTWS